VSPYNGGKEGSAGVGERVRPLDVTLALRAAAARSGRGLTDDQARRIAQIVLRLAKVPAVAITDSVRILAYEGRGCPHMHPGQPVQTRATRRVLRTGEAATIERKADLQCPVEGCPCAIESAVIAPLKLQGQVIGTVKLYDVLPGPMPDYVRRLAVGISELLSLEAEAHETERQRELLAQARLEALQAQIRPHFLFNTLNTVIAMSRRDPELARELLGELAGFLRQTISYRGETATVRDEVSFAAQYLRLEQARFGERLGVRLAIDPGVQEAEMPVLSLQPLVENSVVHGLAAKEGPGRLVVSARRRGTHLQIAVVDDGVGLSQTRLRRLYSQDESTMGLGIANIAGRLEALYGTEAHLRLRSREGRGTAVFLQLPLRRREGNP
jgi:two-component system LytT family sensor kinase